MRPRERSFLSFHFQAYIPRAVQTIREIDLTMRSRLRIIKICVGGYARSASTGALVSGEHHLNLEDFMRGLAKVLRSNIAVATATWGRLSRTARDGLKELTTRYALSVALGDVQFLDGRWYVTHAGLLRLANRDRCCGIHVVRLPKLCDAATKHWVFRAIVYNSTRSKGFVGYGDANPSNVASLVQGAEMRVAETRAVNRALRKAYGIGLCSVEELGSFSSSPSPTRDQGQSQKSQPQNGSNNGHTRLRDRLCLLIRQYSLDPTLVKAYAADFCGTETLKGASRDLVESFITHIAASARENRDGLVCKLNSYAQPVEVKL
jgi:hypothetical protein